MLPSFFTAEQSPVVYKGKRPIKRGRYGWYIWFNDWHPDGTAYRNCHGVTLAGEQPGSDGKTVCSYHGVYNNDGVYCHCSRLVWAEFYKAQRTEV